MNGNCKIARKLSKDIRNSPVTVTKKQSCWNMPFQEQNRLSSQPSCYIQLAATCNHNECICVLFTDTALQKGCRRIREGTKKCIPIAKSLSPCYFSRQSSHSYIYVGTWSNEVPQPRMCYMACSIGIAIASRITYSSSIAFHPIAPFLML